MTLEKNPSGIDRLSKLVFKTHKIIDKCPYCGSNLFVSYSESCGEQVAMVLECRKCGKITFASKNVKVIEL